MKNSPAELRFRDLLPFARRVAGRFITKWPSKRDDLLAAIDMGLWETILRHGNEKDEDLRPLIAVRVRGAVLDELRKQDWFAGRTRVGVYIQVTPLEKIEIIGDELPDCEYMVDVLKCLEKVRGLLGKLTPKQRFVIEEMFFNGKKQNTIAAERGVTESDIAQAKAKAIKALRKLMKEP